ncbi:MAG TPA: MYXO-CTERM sorting domain-containing protein [Polyangiaceae bacterium]|nr:MYXO-CTERM sorting domain-containing protein [Polyangiaceae bacterium]
MLPDWLLALQDAMQSAGVNVDVTGILKTLLDPVILPIKDAVEEYAIGQAKAVVGALVDELEARQGAVEGELAAKLAAASDPALGGTLLDDFFASGLYAHSFNAAAAALAQRAAVLPAGDVGPATFDASHTPAWMQLGACDYLRDAVFPLGLGVRGALSVKRGDTVFAAATTEDSPVECHDGSLTSFAATPSASNCALVSLEGLLSDQAHRGSVSRSYPPELSATKVACQNLVVPGLPAPPPGQGGAGGTAGGSVAGAAGTGADNPGDADPNEDDGCGCRVAGASPRGPALPAAWLGLGLGVALLARRRRLRGLSAPFFLLLASLAAWACGGAGDEEGDPEGPAGAGGAAAGAGAAGQGGSAGGGGAGAAGQGGAGSQSGAQKLIAALGQSVWQGTHDRGGRQRAVELRFDAASLLWAEIDNPFGPSRRRTLRTMGIEPDARTVHTTIVTPSSWPIDPDNGKKEDVTLEVREGAARKLVLTRGGVTEEYVEGAWPEPTDGLTAVVRVFPPGGAVDNAFCNTGALSGPDRDILWAFTRDLRNEGGEKASATDVVAGAKLLRWSEESGDNDFAITDVPGFDRFGGTELSDQFNFIVLYLGTIAHPGGRFALREQNDDIRDALWAFVGDGVGSANTNDLFLEVHGHAPADFTDDEPSDDFEPQDLPIEAMLLRCSGSIDGQAIDLEADLNGAGWRPVGEHATKPRIDATLFPPALLARALPPAVLASWRGRSRPPSSELARALPPVLLARALPPSALLRRNLGAHPRRPSPRARAGAARGGPAALLLEGEAQRFELARAHRLKPRPPRRRHLDAQHLAQIGHGDAQPLGLASRLAPRLASGLALARLVGQRRLERRHLARPQRRHHRVVARHRLEQGAHRQRAHQAPIVDDRRRVERPPAVGRA